MRIVGGKHKRRHLKAPEGPGVRPSSDRTRESVFNILEHGLDDFILDGVSVVDVFAGAGALGLEALSRGTAHATFIDSDPKALRCIRENAGAIGEGQNVTLLKLDATQLPPPPLAAQAPCALAFLDPPYKQNLVIPALASLKARGWIEAGSVCVIECGGRERLDIPEYFEECDRRTYGAAQVLLLRTCL